MKEEISIGSKKLLSIKEVIGRTKYTKDYVAKLARDGSIFGVQVGRQWFIDPSSLESFEQASELELLVRNRQLSGERRREREVKQVLGKIHTTLASSKKYSFERAVTKTIALLVCGLIAGYSVYTLPKQIVSVVFSQKNQLAQVKTWFTQSAEATSEPVEAVQISQVIFEDTVETRRIASSSDGVMLLGSGGTINSRADLEAVFADPVVVEFTDANEGVIFGSSSRLASGSSSAASVHFVMVPLVKAENEQGSEATP